MRFKTPSVIATVGATLLLTALAPTTAGAAPTPATAPAALAATTYYSWSHSITGSSASGRWWKDSNGYSHVDGYVKDTAGDGGYAYAQIHFTKDCCSNLVKNEGGYNTTKYFHFASKGATQFRTKVGAKDFPVWSRESAWKYYSIY